MAMTGWLLAAAVVTAVGWIATIVGTQLMRADRRRQLARQAEQLDAAARMLEAARPGGSVSGAIDVASAAQIEPRAEREPCPHCGGRFHVEAHTVEIVDDDRLRQVVARCGGCGITRTTWFRVAPPPA